jgi:hypothetical protein
LNESNELSKIVIAGHVWQARVHHEDTNTPSIWDARSKKTLCYPLKIVPVFVIEDNLVAVNMEDRLETGFKMLWKMERLGTSPRDSVRMFQIVQANREIQRLSQGAEFTASIDKRIEGPSLI